MQSKWSDRSRHAVRKIATAGIYTIRKRRRKIKHGVSTQFLYVREVKECVKVRETCEAQGHEERAEDGDDSCERDPHLRLDQLNLSATEKQS